MKRFVSVVALLAVAATLAVVEGVAASPAAAETCVPAPQHAGFNFSPVNAVGVPCAEANEVALHVARKGVGPSDWDCGKPTVNGRVVIWACVDRLIAGRTINFSYFVL
jgi:hypothetical protein